MLHYAVAFLVIALIAALLGFGGVAADAAGLAKLLFFVFAGLSALTFVLGLVRRFEPGTHNPDKRGPT